MRSRNRTPVCSVNPDVPVSIMDDVVVVAVHEIIERPMWPITEIHVMGTIDVEARWPPPVIVVAVVVVIITIAVVVGIGTAGPVDAVWAAHAQVMPIWTARHVDSVGSAHTHVMAIWAVRPFDTVGAADLHVVVVVVVWCCGRAGA